MIQIHLVRSTRTSHRPKWSGSSSVIIDDCPDGQAVAILRNVRVAAGADATVLLVEMVLPEHDRDFTGKWVDLPG